MEASPSCPYFGQQAACSSLFNKNMAAGWNDRAQSIALWICDLPEHAVPDLAPLDCPATQDQPPLLPPGVDMPPRSMERRERKLAARRSCSPTKNASQYRITTLQSNGILIDEHHELPTQIEALLPIGLRSILDGSKSSDTTLDAEMKRAILEIAEKYRLKCRNLSKTCGSEPRYRAAMDMLIVFLAELPCWHDTLLVENSDKPWNVELKPTFYSPLLALPWPSLQPLEASLPSTSKTPLSSQDNPDSFYDTTQTSSTVQGTLSTPKPDLVIGLARGAFATPQQRLLAYWQSNATVLSAPYASEGNLLFPFLLLELKGLAANTGLIGAQNQAAGSGVCALRLLASLAAQDPKGLHNNNALRIVFGLTTEGPVHELWVFYQLDNQEEEKYYMTCLRVWRPTMERDSTEFVAVVAEILRWGVEDFLPRVKGVVEREYQSGRAQDAEEQ